MNRDPRHRLDGLEDPHIAPLTEYVRRLRKQRGGGESVPWIDPDDGGVHARVLLLLEAPGARAMGAGTRPQSRGRLAAARSPIPVH